MLVWLSEIDQIVQMHIGLLQDSEIVGRMDSDTPVQMCIDIPAVLVGLRNTISLIRIHRTITLG